MAFKVLFLHGKGENGPTFQQRLGPLEAALKVRNPSVHCEYATAPHELGPGKYAWWQLPPNERSFTTAEYIGMEQTMEHVQLLWSESGPFDAVIAHSQGSILTSVLLAKALQSDFAFRPPKAVLFGAAWPKPYEALLQSLATFDYAESAFKPSSLHVYAMNDNINPPEMAIKIKNLMGSLADAYEHEKGHDIPQDDAAVARVCAFLFD